jgi:hypothetical protein
MFGIAHKGDTLDCVCRLFEPMSDATEDSRTFLVFVCVPIGTPFEVLSAIVMRTVHELSVRVVALSAHLTATMPRTTLNVRHVLANGRPLQIFRIKYGVCQHIERVRVEVLRMWRRTFGELALQRILFVASILPMILLRLGHSGMQNPSQLASPSAQKKGCPSDSKP